MVDDLLAFSRLGRQALSAGPVDMTELVREIWEEAINVGGSNAELKLGDVPPAIGDRAMPRTRCRVTQVRSLRDSLAAGVTRNAARSSCCEAVLAARHAMLQHRRS